MGCFANFSDSFLKCCKRVWYFIILNMMGAKWLLIEIFSRHKSFNIEDVPPRPGQIAVITGGARGIGSEVIKKLLICQMDVVMGCRNVEAGNEAINTIRQSGITSGTVECLPLDLMSFQSVFTFANEILQKKKTIHLLINNAGIMAVPYQLSKDGYESQLQVNHFGHFLLTNLLLRTLIKTSETEDVVPRIINVSSIALFRGDVYYDDFDKKKFYDPYKTYTDAKLFIIVTANYLDRKLKLDGHKVNVFSLHPGIIATNLWDSAPFFVRWMMACITPIFRTVAQGGEDVTYAALSPEIETDSGIFLFNNKQHKTIPIAEDKTVQEKLWEASCKVVDFTS